MRHFLRATIWSANVFFFTTAASPLFTWSYVNPSGFVQPNASVPVDVTITNTGSTVIHGIDGFGLDDTFTPSPYSFSFDNSPFVSDLNLAPGQTSAPLTLGTFSPNPAPVPSGTYAINQSPFTFLEAF